MYYIEALELLKKRRGERLSSSDIFYLLNEQQKVNSLNLKRALTKIYIRQPNVYREWQYTKTLSGKTWREYVYFYSD